jgi:hypothetical protein
MQTFIRAFDTDLCPSVAILVGATSVAIGVGQYFRTPEAGVGSAY